MLQGPEETARYWAVTLPDPAGFRWQGLLRAPVLVIPLVRPDAYAERYGEPDKAPSGLGDLDAWAVPYWWVDGGMAVQTLLLAAVAEGLGACFFGQFAHEEAVAGRARRPARPPRPRDRGPRPAGARRAGPLRRPPPPSPRRGRPPGPLVTQPRNSVE